MEKTFTVGEINEAIEAAKGMLRDAKLPVNTALAQMGGYILRHLNESSYPTLSVPEKLKKEET